MHLANPIEKQAPPSGSDWIRLTDAAAIFPISAAGLYRLVRTGELPGYQTKKRSQVLLNVNDIEKLIKRSRVRV